eukprot:7379387-Prymnesium_polylepis.1
MGPTKLAKPKRQQAGEGGLRRAPGPLRGGRVIRRGDRADARGAGLGVQAQGDGQADEEGVMPMCCSFAACSLLAAYALCTCTVCMVQGRHPLLTTLSGDGQHRISSQR